MCDPEKKTRHSLHSSNEAAVKIDEENDYSVKQNLVILLNLCMSWWLLKTSNIILIGKIFRNTLVNNLEGMSPNFLMQIATL